MRDELDVKIFGEHDRMVVRQLERCVEQEEGSIGVLCADGHYGYSAPIGGVVAYREHVSPAAVGYDIACVDADTEFLTASGWKKICEYEEGDLVMQYDPTTGAGSLVRPERFVVEPCEKFLHLRTKYGIDQMLSEDHRVLCWPYASNSESPDYDVLTAREFADQHDRLKLGKWANFETAFSLERDTQVDMSDEAIRVQVMVNADAYLDVGVRATKAVVSVKKPRKITRAHSILMAAEIEYTTTVNARGYTTFRFAPPFTEKSFRRFWAASYDQLRVVADEVIHWDGNAKTTCFYSRDESMADFVQFAFSATGRRAVKRLDGLDYRVFAYEKTRIGMRGSPKTEIVEEVSHDGQSYCFVVPTGFWVMRRSGKVAMTGNCGNLALATSLHADGEFRRALPGLMDGIFSEVSFGMGRNDGTSRDHPVIDEIRHAEFEPQRRLVSTAAKQLGTVGAGNHYVDLLSDETGRVWIGVHFGSRGFGHKTASGFLAMARGGSFDDRVSDGEMDAAPDVIHVDSGLGYSYVAAMQLAGRYAYAGREVVVDQVLDILGAQPFGEPVHNHHNFAWRENHRGEDFWVVRKGATPAFPGQLGFVGATMGEPSVVLEGLDTYEAQDALRSTVHGAGRAMSRTAAAGRSRRRWSCNDRDCDWVQGPGEPGLAPNVPAGSAACPRGHVGLTKRWVRETEGAIDWRETVDDLRSKGVELRGASAEEAPGAYKRLSEVLAYHADTVRVLRVLTPLGVAMAPGDTRDAYKD